MAKETNSEPKLGLVSPFACCDARIASKEESQNWSVAHFSFLDLDRLILNLLSHVNAKHEHFQDLFFGESLIEHAESESWLKVRLFASSPPTLSLKQRSRLLLFSSSASGMNGITFTLTTEREKIARAVAFQLGLGEEEHHATVLETLAPFLTLHVHRVTVQLKSDIELWVDSARVCESPETRSFAEASAATARCTSPSTVDVSNQRWFVSVGCRSRGTTAPDAQDLLAQLGLPTSLSDEAQVFWVPSKAYFFCGFAHDQAVNEGMPTCCWRHRTASEPITDGVDCARAPRHSHCVCSRSCPPVPPPV